MATNDATREHASFRWQIIHDREATSSKHCQRIASTRNGSYEKEGKKKKKAMH